jgi:hypothetical protein
VKLIRCWPHNSVAKTSSLQATHYSSENWFVASCTIQQQKLVRCKQLNFGSNSYFVATNTLLAMNANFTSGNSISTANHTSIADNTTSAANADLL